MAEGLHLHEASSFVQVKEFLPEKGEIRIRLPKKKKKFLQESHCLGLTKTGLWKEHGHARGCVHCQLLSTACLEATSIEGVVTMKDTLVLVRLL